MQPARPRRRLRFSPGQPRGLRRQPVRRAYTAGMRIAGIVCSVVLATGVLAVAAGAQAPVAARPAPSAAPVSALAAQRQIQHWIRREGLLRHIVRPPAGMLKYPYLIPGAHYYQLFDWDSYFMGVALSYPRRGRALADTVRDFLHFTNLRAAYPGYTPREIAPHGLWSLPEMCKPFLAQMALRASLTLHSAAWLRPDWRRLAATLEYWRQARRSPDGLFTWFDGVESGVDNSPAVSSAPADRTEGVDLACYLVREYRAMAALAGMLHHPHAAAAYARRAAALTRRIQTRLWSAHDGTFYNRDSRTGKFIRVPEWTNLTPLWAGVATPAQARILITRHVLNPQEFWSRYGIRSLGPASPKYDPGHGYWRGPIWIISSYMVMHGLMRYGYRQPARELAARTVRMVLHDFQATGGMHECYDPRNGRGLFQGHFESWDLLAAHMVSEAETGYDPTAIPAAAPGAGTAAN